MTPTTAELIFWAVCAVLAILFLVAIPFISNCLENKDTERMFARYELTEYHDDMEDWA